MASRKIGISAHASREIVRVGRQADYKRSPSIAVSVRYKDGQHYDRREYKTRHAATLDCDEFYGLVD